VNKVTSPKPARKGPSGRSSGKQSSSRDKVSKARGARRLPLVGAVVVVVAVVLLGAIIITAATRDKGTADGVEQIRPVGNNGDALPAYDSSGSDTAIGTTAPVLQGQSFDGTKVTVGGKTAKPTLVMFVAHWCPHCQAEVPRVVGWRKEGTIPSDIDLVAVSTAVDKAYPNYPPSSWLEKVGWPGATMADDANSSGAQAYGLSAYPFFVALDKDGTVLQRGTGELTRAEVQQLVQKLQAS
jgi:thiol-disulfide isomerase/thioredoxin